MVTGWGRASGSLAGLWDESWSYLANSSSVSSTPHSVSFLLFELGTKYMDSALFERLQLHSIRPSPSSLLRLPSPWGLSKNKESLLGREWVGTAHREYTELQMWGSSHSAPLCLHKSHDHLKPCLADGFQNPEEAFLLSFPIWKGFSTCSWRFSFRFPTNDVFP